MRIQIWETNICHHRTYPVSLCKAPPITPLTHVQRLSRVPCEHGSSSKRSDAHAPDDPFYCHFHFTEKREIRCMDLGKTALGNWKAQQGGCTHIQVRSLIRSYSTVVCAISQGGRISSPSAPPFFSFSLCSSSTKSMISSESLFPFFFLFFKPRHYCSIQQETDLILPPLSFASVLPTPIWERCTNCGMEFSKHYLRQNLLMEVRGVPA